MTALDQILTLEQRMGESVIGRDTVVERILIGLPANGNLLVEGLPGLAKAHQMTLPHGERSGLYGTA